MKSVTSLLIGLLLVIVAAFLQWISFDEEQLRAGSSTSWGEIFSGFKQEEQEALSGVMPLHEGIDRPPTILQSRSPLAGVGFAALLVGFIVVVTGFGLLAVAFRMMRHSRLRTSPDSHGARTMRS